MPLAEFSSVRLLTDKYSKKGVCQGDIGVILDVYEDGYEVEFSRPDGTTIAWFAVRPEDVEAVPEGVTHSADRSVL